MPEEARLALQKIKINRRIGSLFVYDDRFVISTDAGESVIPMGRLDKLATRRTVRGAKLLMLFDGDEVVEVRGLSASDTTVAHRTIVGVARAFH
jgi:hypothetical protein